METDKKTVARRLIHSAIRQTIHGEDPLAVHLVSMACYDLLWGYGEAKGIDLTTANPVNQLAPDVRNKVVKAAKRTYYFLKHSRNDADDTIDETKIVPFTDLMLVTVIGMYAGCFPGVTEHMKIFCASTALRFPSLFDPAAWEQFTSVPANRIMTSRSRSEWMSHLQDSFARDADIKAEREADLATLRAGQEAKMPRVRL
jgi:hypothetical protein